MQKIKLIVASLWALLFFLGVLAWLRTGIQLEAIPELLHQKLSQFGLLNAAFIYIFIYILRPIILLPATILTMASGLIFGPWLGILFTTIGENFSANFAFLMARWLGRDWVKSHEQDKLLKWEDKLRENGMVTVLIMRLIYIPFDAVNFACGLTSMRQVDYAIGTFIGIIPGMVTFVLLGGSAAAGVENRTAILVGSVICFFSGLVIARIIKKRTVTSNLNSSS
ncbi:MAG: TVP38/TMEM64 family protein [Pseudomonadales bacterium]|nr:TVP38/TMEM64 family protein [Pseudomonadales bacterium]